MKEDSSILNKEAGLVLGKAIKSHPSKQKGVAETLSVSTKQLQNYSKGIFPRFKNANIKALDRILGTKVFDMVYENLKKEPKVRSIDLDEETDLGYAVRKLADATDRHSIIDDRNSRNIERLISLLELKYGANGELDAYDPMLPIPDSTGVKENRLQEPVSKSISKRKPK